MKQRAGANFKVFAVWEPMLATDWQSPGELVLARLKDSRVQQYWDPGHLLALRLAADAHDRGRNDPQPSQACCLSDNILWDLAALYPAGAQWKETLPPAIFFNGSIIERRDELATALNGLLTVH